MNELSALAKNFRGFFSQSSLNNATVLLSAAADEVASGSLQVSPNTVRFLELGGLFLQLAHVFVNAAPEIVNQDVPPHPSAPQPLALASPQPVPEPAPAPAPVVAPEAVAEASTAAASALGSIASSVAGAAPPPAPVADAPASPTEAPSTGS